MGAAIGALGSAYGASVSSSASSDAADKAAQTQMYALMMQKKIYDEQMARQQPFYEQGISSLEDYAKMLKGGYDMKQSPAAQYELEQGTKALNRQLAARGMSGGGIAAIRLAELSGGVAARDWQNQYSRLVDSLKLGTGAANSMNQSSQNYMGSARNTLSDLAGLATRQGDIDAGTYNSLYKTSENFNNAQTNAFMNFMKIYSGGGMMGG